MKFFRAVNKKDIDNLIIAMSKRNVSTIAYNNNSDSDKTSNIFKLIMKKSVNEYDMCMNTLLLKYIGLDYYKYKFTYEFDYVKQVLIVNSDDNNFIDYIKDKNFIIDNKECIV